MGRALGLATFVAVFLALVALRPERLYGDDVFFLRCIVDDFPFAPHFLFMPLARGVARIGAACGLDPLGSLRLLSAAATAGSAVLLFGAGLRLGLGRYAAWLAALVVVSAPSTVFFGTAAEVHAPHLLAVAFLSWSLARLRPSARPRDVAALLVAFILVVGTHKSGILFAPAVLVAYLLRTPGRPRRNDLLLGLAGVLGFAFVKAGFTWLETGSAGGREDSPLFYWEALSARIANGYGPSDFLAYLASDLVAPAAGLALGAAAGLGALVRRAPRQAAFVALAAGPHVVFFALFNYPEHGAYFVALLPLAACCVFAWLLGTRADTPQPATPRLVSALFPGFALVLVLVAAGSSETFLDTLPAPALVGLLAATFGTTLFLPLPPLPRRSAPIALGVFLGLQAATAVGHILDFDRERPLLAFARGACLEADGRDAVVLTADFGELQILHALDAPWPAPYRGTWKVLRDLPLPGPTGHAYGDPALTADEVLNEIAQRVATDRPVYVARSVRDFLARRPEHGALLRRLASLYELVPLEREGFRAERPLPHP